MDPFVNIAFFITTLAAIYAIMIIMARWWQKKKDRRS